MNINKLIRSDKDIIEIFCLLDSNEKELLNYVRNIPLSIKNFHIVEHNTLDIGEIKNLASKKATGDYILFVEEGILLSLNTIEAFKKGINDNKNGSKKNIFVPETKIFFGKELYMEKNISTNDPKFSEVMLLLTNPWGNVFLMSRKNFCKVQFPKVDFKNKLNPHILSFYCDCIGLGYKILPMQETISFVRLDEEINLESNFILPSKKIFNEKAVRINIEDNDKDPNQDITQLKIPKAKSSILYQEVKDFNYKINHIREQINDKSDKRNILKKVFSSIFPRIYLKMYVLKKNMYKNQNESIYPEWLVNEWKKINIIEPELFPPKYKILEKEIKINPNFTSYLSLFLSNFQKGTDYLIFCPWLKVGGADRLTLNLVKSLRQLFPKRSIGVITTEKIDSEWASKLPSDISYFDFGNSFLDLSFDERDALFLRAIIQINPKKIININSHKLYYILSQHSKSIATFSDIYCFIFCLFLTEEGQTRGFAVENIPSIYDSLKGILTDNSNIINYICDNFGVDKRKFHTIYQPVDTNNFIHRELKNNQEINILWASRIDDQKLPYVLEGIIKESQNLGYKYHIYGSKAINYSYDFEKFKKFKNVFVYGPFKDSLVNIQHSNLDIYLYTSKFDGIPTTLLEALSIGLPVVASNVGGIPEIIEENKTGYLVEDIYNPKAYLEKIKMLVENKLNLSQIELNAKQALEERHSWNQYLKVIERVFK